MRSEVADLYAFDTACRARAAVLVGLDEAGRGPLAGPVVAAAVRLDPAAAQIAGLDDSKKLSERQREALYAGITAGPHAWAVGEASVEEIDRLNILQASLLAMRRALEQIAGPWGLALVDGNQAIPGLDPKRQETVVGGDARSASVAAASIVAKVTRDRMMAEYAARYPGYEFSRHKGYPTKLHLERIRSLGLCDIHRRTFCGHLCAQMALQLD